MSDTYSQGAVAALPEAYSTYYDPLRSLIGPWDCVLKSTCCAFIYVGVYVYRGEVRAKVTTYIEKHEKEWRVK